MGFVCLDGGGYSEGARGQKRCGEREKRKGGTGAGHRGEVHRGKSSWYSEFQRSSRGSRRDTAEAIERVYKSTSSVLGKRVSNPVNLAGQDIYMVSREGGRHRRSRELCASLIRPNTYDSSFIMANPSPFARSTFDDTARLSGRAQTVRGPPTRFISPPDLSNVSNICSAGC